MEPLITAPDPRPTDRISSSNVSLKLLAVALILVFLYYAAGVVITLLLSILIAYFLDPAVESLERARMPRTIAAMVTVLILIAVLGVVGYGLWSGGSSFAANWPKYGGTLRHAVGSAQSKLSGLERQVTEENEPSAQDAAHPKTEAGAENVVHTFLVRIIGSLYALVLEVTFVPFLVYFLLSWSDHLRTRFLFLFDGEDRDAADHAWIGVASGVRAYVVGNFLLGVVLSIARG